MLKIKPDALDDLLKNIEQQGFTADGCDCGDYCYKLNDKLYLYAHRGCKESITCPEHKWWHVNELQFYKDVKFFWKEYDGKQFISDIEVEEEDLLDLKLDKGQNEIIRNKLREVSLEYCGEEYRYE